MKALLGIIILSVALLAATGIVATWLVPVAGLIIISTLEYKRYREKSKN